MTIYRKRETKQGLLEKQVKMMQNWFKSMNLKIPSDRDHLSTKKLTDYEYLKKLVYIAYHKYLDMNEKALDFGYYTELYIKQSGELVEHFYETYNFINSDTYEHSNPQLNAQAEVAMMGFVTPFHKGHFIEFQQGRDLVYLVSYITKTLNIKAYYIDCLNKIVDKDITAFVCNRVNFESTEDVLLTFLISDDTTRQEDIEPWRKPTENNPIQYCYTLNLSSPWCSEYGYVTLEKVADGIYRRKF